MFAALLNDASRSLLNHPLESECASLKHQDVSAPRTPDNEEFSGTQRALQAGRLHLPAAPPDGRPVASADVFMQPPGAAPGTAVESPWSLLARGESRILGCFTNAPLPVPASVSLKSWLLRQVLSGGTSALRGV